MSHSPFARAKRWWDLKLKKGVHQPPQEHQHSDRRQNDTHYQVQSAVQELGRIVETISTFTTQHKTHHEQNQSAGEKAFSISKWTFWLAVATTVLTLATALGGGVSAWAIYGQLSEMKDEQRPWISAQKVELSGKLSKTENGVTISIAARLINTGHLPASGVFLNPITLPHLPGSLLAIPALARKPCDGRNGQIGLTVFPGSETNTGINFTFPNSDINETNAGMPSDFWTIHPFIVLCISYRGSDMTVHRTPYIFELKTSSPGNIFGDVPLNRGPLENYTVVLSSRPFFGVPPD